MRAEGPDGMVGHGMVEVDHSHPKYAFWLADYELAQASESTESGGHGPTKPRT